MLVKAVNWVWITLTPENIQRWLASLGGRRFLLSLGAGVVSSVLVWYGKIDGSIYRDVVIGTVGLYIAGNTAQKMQGPKSTNG